jgi:hypothetical protein
MKVDELTDLQAHYDNVFACYIQAGVKLQQVVDAWDYGYTDVTQDVWMLELSRAINQAREVLP